MTDEEREELKDKLMQADLNLRQKQTAWETPKNIAILAGAVAALAAAIGGWTGYRIGQTAGTPAVQQLILPPGTTIQTPPAPK